MQSCRFPGVRLALVYLTPAVLALATPGSGCSAPPTRREPSTPSLPDPRPAASAPATPTGAGQQESAAPGLESKRDEAGSPPAASALEERGVDRWKHLFLDFTHQALNEPGEETSYAGSVGANWTLPLLPKHLVGLQIGGDATWRDINPEYDGTAGAFGRGLRLADGLEAGGALLVDYRHTQRQGNLFAARPTGGIDIGDNDTLGAQGVIALNDDIVSRRGGNRVRQRIVPRSDIFWGHRWGEKLSSELSGGYQFGNVDRAIFGGQITWAFHPMFQLVGMGEINTGSDFAAGVSLVFDLGASGQSSTLRRFGSRAGWTPFPKRSFPVMLVETSQRGGRLGTNAGVLSTSPGVLPDPPMDPGEELCPQQLGINQGEEFPPLSGDYYCE